MMFLIRTAFWLFVVIMLIPVDDEVAREAAGRSVASIGTIEAVSAAQATISDVSGFCDRNPDVCTVGGKVAHTFALKAKSGAKMLGEFVDGQLAEEPVDHGTLTPADVSPEWHGPLKNAQNT